MYMLSDDEIQEVMCHPFYPFGEDPTSEQDQVDFDMFYEAIRERLIGQDKELEKLAYDVYAYKKSIENGNNNAIRHNVIIAGASASGKTEFFRILRDLFNEWGCTIPVIQLDATSFTATGFQGQDVEEIAKEIHKQGSSGAAIVFLDEFDKVLMPVKTQNGENFNGVLQNHLLTLIEGRKIDVGRKEYVDTSLTMFIGMGAFTEFRRGAAVRKEEKAEKRKCIGFLCELTEDTEEKDNVVIVDNGDDYKLTMEDLLKVGGSTELIGRFDEIYNFTRISKEDFPLLFERLATDFMKKHQILIRYSDKAVDEFYACASSEFGCRELKKILYRSVKDCLIEIERSGCERHRACIELDGINDACAIIPNVQGYNL